MIWQQLLTNFAIVAVLISLWTHVRDGLDSATPHLQNLIFGLVMGTGAVISMMMSVRLANGILFDLRASLVAIAAAFGGPFAALLAAGMAVVYRNFVGGDGALIGSINIIVSTLCGVVFFAVTRKKVPTVPLVLLLALGVAGAKLASLASLPHATLPDALARFGVSLGVMSFAATAVAGLVILIGRRSSTQRKLLSAAWVQAPDFQYIKDTKGRFVAVNEAVARLNGYASPDQIVGLSDFDITTPDRARALFEAEQKLMKSGLPFAKVEEQMTDRFGQERWFSTSKVALYDSQGKVIGLAGVTRDMTAPKKLENELIESRKQLAFALSEMADGLAMFDAEGVLVFANDRYREAFPLTADIRRPGIHLREILAAVVATGEQVFDPGEDTDAWVEKTLETLRIESEQEIELYDGRWVHVRSRPADDGRTLVVISDITKIKQIELDLVQSTKLLSDLASTDGLTGLLNRRTFDQTLQAELARSASNKLPISLLLLDVDNFKAFNDIYGHSAGDSCLRTIARNFKKSLEHAGDIAARYGGEEFTITLPDTDVDGAMIVAQRVQQAMRQSAIPHSGSINGIVSVSIGLATFTANDGQLSPAELVDRADKALYRAKASGRDRVVVWQPTLDQRMA